MVGPVNVKKIYAKCEKKVWSVGFRGVNISKIKNPGKCHDLQRKCKIKKKTCGWIMEIVGGFRG